MVTFRRVNKDERDRTQTINDWLFWWELKEVTRKGVCCHKCKVEIPKRQYRVTIDLGRMTKTGRPWYHLLCIPCMYEELNLVKEYMDELKYRIEKKLIKQQTKTGGDDIWES